MGKKTQKYHTVKTFPKSNRKIVEIKWKTNIIQLS